MPYVTERWPGGMLTNFPTIRKAVKKMSAIDKMSTDGTFETLSKRERLQIARQRAKLEKRELDSAESRVVTLRELLGESTPGLEQIQQALIGAFCDRFGLQAEAAELTGGEKQLAEELLNDEIGTADFINGVDEPTAARGMLRGEHASPGGRIVSYLRLEGPAQNRFREALITGDFFVTPPRVIYDLESSLRGVYLDDLESTIESFFTQAGVEVLSVSPADFIASIRNALK